MVNRSADDVVIVGGARTPFGKLNGSLSALNVVDLATHAFRAALERSCHEGLTLLSRLIHNGQVNHYVQRDVADDAGQFQAARATTTPRAPWLGHLRARPVGAGWGQGPNIRARGPRSRPVFAGQTWSRLGESNSGQPHYE